MSLCVAPSAGSSSRFSHLPVCAALAAMIAVGALVGCKRGGETSASQVSASANAPAADAKPAGVPEPVRRVVGRWVRQDGGYVLEIRGGATGGVLEAGYFNPKSINVSRAAWYEGGGSLQVLVELNDVGYPGATYVLRHDAKADRLLGTYTQPSLQQTFEIEFARETAK